MGRTIICRIRARLPFELQRALWHRADLPPRKGPKKSIFEALGVR